MFCVNISLLFFTFASFTCFYHLVKHLSCENCNINKCIKSLHAKYTNITVTGPCLQWWESCHRWFHYQQLFLCQLPCLTTLGPGPARPMAPSHARQMSIYQAVNSTAVTFIYRNAVRWGPKFKKAPVFCFCPLFPFVNALTIPQLPVRWVTK